MTKSQQKRGFAAMDPERHREIAAKGGREAQQSGRAHRWTSEEASVAGRIGGSRCKGWRKQREE